MDKRALERAWQHGEQAKAKNFLGIQNLTPWEALLLEVQRTAYRAQWIDQQADTAAQHLHAVIHLDPGEKEYKTAYTNMREWLTQSRDERKHLTTVSKAAIDAGIANILVHQAQIDGKTIATVLGRALDALDLDDEQKAVAGRSLRAALEEASREGLQGPADVRGASGLPTHAESVP